MHGEIISSLLHNPIKLWKQSYIKITPILGLIMSPHLYGGGHIVFGAYPISIGFSVGIGHSHLYHTFLSAQYLVNKWLDSYQILMDI